MSTGENNSKRGEGGNLRCLWGFIIRKAKLQCLEI